MTKTVLFICTGNYYRSRFAEILFNHLAALNPIRWQAVSRGFAPSPRNEGPLSVHTVSALRRPEIPFESPDMPRQLSVSDLENAGHIVAVQEAEHLPMMQRLFPEWTERTEFWNVPDIEFREPTEALTELEQDVRRLFRRLNSSSNLNVPVS